MKRTSIASALVALLAVVAASPALATDTTTPTSASQQADPWECEGAYADAPFCHGPSDPEGRDQGTVPLDESAADQSVSNDSGQDESGQDESVAGDEQAQRSAAEQDEVCKDYGRRVTTKSVNGGVATFTVPDDACDMEITFTVYSEHDDDVADRNYDRQYVHHSLTRTYGPGEYRITRDLPACSWQSDLYVGPVREVLANGGQANPGHDNVLLQPAGQGRSWDRSNDLAPCPDDYPGGGEAVYLRLKAMCELDGTTYWRVQNKEDFEVDFVAAGGANVDGTATPGWSYFEGDAADTTIAWGGGNSGLAPRSFQASATTQPCEYRVSLDKQWDGTPPQEIGPFVKAQSDGKTKVITNTDGRRLTIAPDGQYRVWEQGGPEGWFASSGTGTFTVPSWPGPETFFGTYPDITSGTRDIVHTVVNSPLPTVALNLTSMCQVEEGHVWRVLNNGDDPVDFRVTLGAGDDGTAAPGWTYFYGDAATTTIEWGGGDTGYAAGRKTKAANQEDCAHQVVIDKQWVDGQAPDGGPFVEATNGTDTVTEADPSDQALRVLPGADYTVTETPPAGWLATSGLGTFSVPEWTGPETFFGTYPSFDDATKFVTHTVVNEPLPTATPVDPTITPSTECGVEGSVEIPDTEGVVYLLDGEVVSGTITGPVTGTLTAQAADGYVLGTPDWSTEISLAGASACEPEPAISAAVLGPACDLDTPFLDYRVEVIGTTATDVTVHWFDANGVERATTTSEGLEGRVLWPGAEIDANGNPVDWPGWVQLADGNWVEQDDGFAWARGEGITVTIEVNPTSDPLAVRYPIPTPDCAAGPTLVNQPAPTAEPTEAPATVVTPTNEATAPSQVPTSSPTEVAGLASTGTDSAALLGIAAGLVALGGALLALARRRLRA